MSMVSTFTLSSPSLNLAIDKTFDGDHPCELCKAISAAEKQNHEDSPKSRSKRDAPKTYLSQLPFPFALSLPDIVR